jgi:hypothetical protein
MAEDKKKQEEARKDSRFPLTRLNYKLLAIGFVIIVLGFILMIGGKAEDLTGFNPEIFNFRRITLAPMLVLGGFLFEIFAIMYRGKKRDTDSDNAQ